LSRLQWWVSLLMTLVIRMTLHPIPSLSAAQTFLANPGDIKGTVAEEPSCSSFPALCQHRIPIAYAAI
jgi:hypothetical protein